MFKNLFRAKTENHDSQLDDKEIGRAVAALLVEAARADENYTDKEKAIITRTLSKAFSLDEAAAAALRASGEAAQTAALDIQRFTRLAKTMTTDEKISFVESLWEIVLSDGERDPFEDALIRRICGLIYLDDKESGAARARILARTGGA